MMSEGIYDLLARIEKRPPLYLGGTNISLLAAFLNGYSYSQELNARREEDDMPPFEMLNDWTAIRFNQGHTSAGWCRILTAECQEDETAALHLFFEVLREFKQVQALRIVKVSLSPSNLAYFHSDSCKVRRHLHPENVRSTAPDTVYVAHFSGGLGYYVYHHLSGQQVACDRSQISFQDALEELGLEFGPELNWKDSLDLSASAVASIV